MLRKSILIVFGLAVFAVSCDEKKKPSAPMETKDSIEKYMQRSYEDSIPISIRKVYARKILDVISKSKNDSLNRSYYFRVANRYFNMDDFANYKLITKKVIKDSERVNDSASIAKGYTYLLDYYIKVNKPDSLYYYTYKAEKLYRYIKDKPNLAQTLLNKAILQHNKSDYLGCERTVFEVLRLMENSNNPGMVYEANNLLGIVYGEIKEFKLSEKYYSIALRVGTSGKLPTQQQLKATTLNNIGLLYFNQGKFDLAKRTYLTALQESSLLQDRPDIYAMLTDNLAYVKLRTKSLQELPEMFYTAMKLADSLKQYNIVALTKRHLSEYFAIQKDTTNALRFAAEAYDISKDNNEKRSMLFALKQLAAVNPQRAFKYSSEYYKIIDSLEIDERKITNKFARIEFETDELAAEKGQLVEQRKTLIYVSLAIILIGLFAFIIRTQASKNRELRLMQEQQKANEEIYQLMINQQNKVEEVRQAEKKRIAQELHDGVLGKLFGTRMNLGVLNRKIDEKAMDDRDVYIDELKTLEQEIREISHDLNSEKTAVFNNFVLMVNNFFETQRTVCQAEIQSDISPEIQWNEVDNIAKINLYRILQEAFQNINKHANAQNVAVSFEKINNFIRLKIEDNGVGFNYGRKKNGIGMLNMQSRISSSGGTMEVQTSPGAGTSLQFELPLT